MTEPSRRRFLRSALFGSAAVVTVPALSSCVPEVSPAAYVDLAVPELSGSKVILSLTKYPELARPGGAIIIRHSSLPSSILVTQSLSGAFKATSALCSHVGCPLGFDGTDIVCPCHLSKFDTAGNVLQAPATVKLQAYAATSDGANVTVSLGAGDFPPIQEGKVTLLFTDYPALRTKCGVALGTPSNGTKPLLVLAKSGGGFSAVDPTCPHLQCAVAYKCSSTEFLCPCHASTFKEDGTLITGPATSSLKSFVVTVDATSITITIP